MLEVRFNPPVQRLSSILLLKLKVWWWETSTSNLAYFAFAYQETFSSGTTLRNTLFNCVTQVFLGIIAFFVDNFWQLDIIFSTFWLGHISPEILHCHLCLQSRQWVAVTALRWRPGSRLQRLWTRQREIEDRDRVERSRSSENCFPISEPLNWNCNCRLPSCKMKINYQPHAGDKSQSILTVKCGYFLALGPPVSIQLNQNPKYHLVTI